jgi:hypothetical protein
MRADVGGACAEPAVTGKRSLSLTRCRIAWLDFLSRISPAGRWCWPLTIAIAGIYAASFAIFIHHHTSLPFFDGYGYVVKTSELAAKFHDASFSQRLNPALYLGGFQPQRPPLMMSIAAIVLGPNPSNAAIAYVWLAVRVAVILLALYLLSREFGTARFVPAAALTIFASPLMCNFYRLHMMDEPFAAFGLLAFALILVDDRRQTFGSALAAASGILALFLVKPVAPAFVFPFCVVRAGRALLSLRHGWPDRGPQIRRLAMWVVPYVFLFATMVALIYASPYGPAIREQFKLGSAGYWHREITASGTFQLVSLVLPPWILISFLFVLPFARGFRHGTILLYALGGLLWWLLFSFFLTYAVADRLLGQAMPYVVTAILAWICQRPKVALLVTMIAGLFFTHNIRAANGRIKFRRGSVAAMVGFLSPVPSYQEPVPEVGLLPFASRLQAALKAHESKTMYGVFGDTYVEPSTLKMALRMNTQADDVQVQRLPTKPEQFELRQVFQTQWFITKTRRQNTGYEKTGLWTTVNCVHALITDPTSSLHSQFHKVLEHPVYQPGLDDTLVLWQLPSAPPDSAIIESLQWLKPRLTNDPPAFTAAIESQIKALSP